MGIRQLRGHSDVFKPPSFDTLQHAAKYGSVIVIIISKHRSDAVIVLNARDPVLDPLPKASPVVLNDLSTKFQESLEKESPISREPYDIVLYVAYGRMSCAPSLTSFSYPKCPKRTVYGGVQLAHFAACLYMLQVRIRRGNARISLLLYLPHCRVLSRPGKVCHLSLSPNDRSWSDSQMILRFHL